MISCCFGHLTFNSGTWNSLIVFPFSGFLDPVNVRNAYASHEAECSHKLANWMHFFLNVRVSIWRNPLLVKALKQFDWWPNRWLLIPWLYLKLQCKNLYMCITFFVGWTSLRLFGFAQYLAIYCFLLSRRSISPTSTSSADRGVELTAPQHIAMLESEFGLTFLKM